MSVGEHSSKGWPWGKSDVLGCGHSCEAAACRPALMAEKQNDKKMYSVPQGTVLRK